MGRGRRALASMRHAPNGRRVTVMARVVRHRGARYRAAPLARHIRYLEREGVTRDGRDASMFDSEGDSADRTAFAKRCEGDRHHFRFIVSPEDATDLGDLRAFTRDLMKTAAKDLGSELDWIAVDHWNTDNPHIHVLVRGLAEDGTDLVIDRGYVSAGFRGRAEELATLELGPRSERDVALALEREVDAERWTSLDARLQQLGDETGGMIDLRPDPRSDREMQRLLVGRAATLEKMGLAERQGPGCWTVDPGTAGTLRDLAIRSDIIKTMHRALTRGGGRFDPSALSLHGDVPDGPVIGRLVERGLHDELVGSSYAIVEGADGRTHHLRFDDMEMTGDAKPGAIVELRSWDDTKGQLRLSLATRSDLPLEAQIIAPGATWLDRQLVAREPVACGNGFGIEIRGAIAARARHLAEQGLATRQGQRIILARDLIDKLKSRDLDAAGQTIAERTGLAPKRSAAGEYVSGIYRERVTLSSGRFAMIDDGLGFQLVPWRPALDKHLGQHVTGIVAPGGSIDWSLGRSRGIGL
jgi:type IV secretory pathway VirD2 relaxase